VLAFIITVVTVLLYQVRMLLNELLCIFGTVHDFMIYFGSKSHKLRLILHIISVM